MPLGIQNLLEWRLDSNYIETEKVWYRGDRMKKRSDSLEEIQRLSLRQKSNKKVSEMGKRHLNFPRDK